jgi:hypothetical protein
LELPTSPISDYVTTIVIWPHGSEKQTGFWTTCTAYVTLIQLPMATDTYGHLLLDIDIYRRLDGFLGRKVGVYRNLTHTTLLTVCYVAKPPANKCFSPWYKSQKHLPPRASALNWTHDREPWVIKPRWSTDLVVQSHHHLQQMLICLPQLAT